MVPNFLFGTHQLVELGVDSNRVHLDCSLVTPQISSECLATQVIFLLISRQLHHHPSYRNLRDPDNDANRLVSSPSSRHPKFNNFERHSHLLIMTGTVS